MENQEPNVRQKESPQNVFAYLIRFSSFRRVQTLGEKVFQQREKKNNANI